MTVAVVTPWHDQPGLVADYMDAIRAGAPDELIVVDNGSDPPLHFAAVRLERNLGFSAGCNTGLRAATSDVVVFLNNDVAMRDPGWLDAIREAAEPGVLVGARLRHDRHGDVDGHPFPYLDGWCLAGMRDELVALGGFDETFREPAYYSDNDLCLRARLAGMRLREARVGLVHKTGATVGSHAQPHVQAAVKANYQRFAARAREALTVGAAA